MEEDSRNKKLGKKEIRMLDIGSRKKSKVKKENLYDWEGKRVSSSRYKY